MENSKKQEAWNTFLNSGKVEDFLNYNSISKGETYGNDKNKGDSGFFNPNWGK